MQFNKRASPHGGHGVIRIGDEEVIVKKAVSMNNTNEVNPQYDLFRKATLELGDSNR